MKFPNTLFLVLLLLTSNVSFATVYTDSSDFFSNAGSLDLEGFEALPVTNSFDSSALSLLGFELTTNAAMGVFSGVQGNGTHPTDGSAFVHHFLSGSSSLTVTFTFANSIVAFGLTTTDWAELVGGPDIYTLTTNAGDYLSITDNLEQPGTELFSGVVNAAGFTSVSLNGPLQGDAFGVDSVYFSTVPTPATIFLFLWGLVLLTTIKASQMST